MAKQQRPERLLRPLLFLWAAMLSLEIITNYRASCKIPLRLQNVSGHDRGTGEPGYP
jgi:hypothetical protein